MIKMVKVRNWKNIVIFHKSIEITLNVCQTLNKKHSALR